MSGGEVMKEVILHSKSYRLKMWAAASLKRLLSDFYNSPDGTYSSKVFLSSRKNSNKNKNGKKTSVTNMETSKRVENSG